MSIHLKTNDLQCLNHTVNEALERIDLSTNYTFGFLVVNLKKLQSLSEVVAERVLQKLILHVGGAWTSLHYKSLKRVYHELQKDLPQQIGRSVLYLSHKQKNVLVIGRVLPNKRDQKLVPISIGETVHWDGRWRITLKPFKGNNRGRSPTDKREQLYIRHMDKGDWNVPQRGLRIIRSTLLPHQRIRGGLPMISKKDGYVVLAPSLQVADYTYGVDCDVQFDPLLPLVQDTEAHVHYIHGRHVA